MRSNTELTIIIPACREEETIIETLHGLNSVKTPHTVLVVNDFSDPLDKTKDIVKNNFKKVSVIVNTNPGFAQTIAAGVQKTATPYLVFVMADACDDPKTIDAMYKKIQEGYDVVCGSRYMPGGQKIGGPKIQGFFSYLVNTYLSFTLPTGDASNSFKMYKTSVIKPLLSPIRGGVEYSIELITRAHANGARITDIPTTWRGRLKGTSKFHILARAWRYARIVLRRVLNDNV